MRLVVDNEPSPPATISQIAAAQFLGVKEFRGLTKEQRIDRVRGMFDCIYPMAVLGLEVMALDKAEFINKVEEAYDAFGPSLMMFTRAREKADALLRVLRSAEIRLASALAVVEGPLVQ